MHILVCSPSWPTTKTIDFIFVDQLSRAFADLGCKVTVIAPQSITKCIMRHIPVAKLHSFYKTSNGNTIEIFRPSYISMGNTGSKLLKNSFQMISYSSVSCSLLVDYLDSLLCGFNVCHEIFTPLYIIFGLPAGLGCSLRCRHINSRKYYIVIRLKMQGVFFYFFLSLKASRLFSVTGYPSITSPTSTMKMPGRSVNELLTQVRADSG